MKNKNPARRASEKNNLAPILSEKKYLSPNQKPKPPPPWISNGPCLIGTWSRFLYNPLTKDYTCTCVLRLILILNIVKGLNYKNMINILFW